MFFDHISNDLLIFLIESFAFFVDFSQLFFQGLHELLVADDH
jgi:hypothetical protein